MEGRDRAGAGERGSVLPLVALGVVLCGMLAVGAGRLGGDAVARAQAVTAADAAALAGAAAGPEEARAVAEANGGELVTYRARGTDVIVEVEVGSARASARARRMGPVVSPDRR